MQLLKRQRARKHFLDPLLRGLTRFSPLLSRSGSICSSRRSGNIRTRSARKSGLRHSGGGIRGSYMDRIFFTNRNRGRSENTPEALADAIEDFSAKKLSRLGETAAENAESLYSWPSVFEELFCIYREVCANYRRF